mmetsp:Transcript_76543/g.194245  ORF Transcript_76543/g.194245 Transcript_76543/m.194245 type:complete len:232 (-) Transcript_76543:23-718(-)
MGMRIHTRSTPNRRGTCAWPPCRGRSNKCPSASRTCPLGNRPPSCTPSCTSAWASRRTARPRTHRPSKPRRGGPSRARPGGTRSLLRSRSTTDRRRGGPCSPCTSSSRFHSVCPTSKRTGPEQPQPGRCGPTPCAEATHWARPPRRPPLSHAPLRKRPSLRPSGPALRPRRLPRRGPGPARPGGDTEQPPARGSGSERLKPSRFVARWKSLFLGEQGRAVGREKEHARACR